MKKRILFVIFLLILPFIVNAKMSSNYEDAVHFAYYYTDYLGGYDYYSRFMLGRSDFSNNPSTDNKIPFRFKNGVLSGDNSFFYGGFLNLDEFNISKNKQGDTYLYNGNDYWTMTESGNKAYIITNKSSEYTSLEDMSSTSGTRITEYLAYYVEPYGSGSYNDPWQLKRPPE